MKTTEKLIIAGIVGTTFMTLYSYYISKKENEKYLEPEMINELIDNSKNLPNVNNERYHPAGWGLHYVTGISFMAVYWLLWKRALTHPTISKILIIGSLSGVVGIIVWKIIFSQHEKPPHNDRYGYYKQLFTAHIIFSFFALSTYKLCNKADNYTIENKH
ncbi:hypothetical protein [Flavobacterium sp. NRK1]|uniref:hypothetical protein n=1 Tax=Flavobacterium sp. NRK1 TaxID=2954929 RepID=UPI002093B604|nr:hypothetical protein [Flavobacterium sp. NRK1]MCO6149471.1 hypothetical protein [Flavobacterium sp. NRK1]